MAKAWAVHLKVRSNTGEQAQGNKHRHRTHSMGTWVHRPTEAICKRPQPFISHATLPWPMLEIWTMNGLNIRTHNIIGPGRYGIQSPGRPSNERMVRPLYSSAWLSACREACRVYSDDNVKRASFKSVTSLDQRRNDRAFFFSLRPPGHHFDS